MNAIAIEILVLAGIAIFLIMIRKMAMPAKTKISIAIAFIRRSFPKVVKTDVSSYLGEVASQVHNLTDI